MNITKTEKIIKQAYNKQSIVKSTTTLNMLSLTSYLMQLYYLQK